MYSCSIIDKKQKTDIGVQPEGQKSIKVSVTGSCLDLSLKWQPFLQEFQNETVLRLVSSSLIFLCVSDIVHHHHRPLWLTSVSAGIKCVCRHYLACLADYCGYFSLWLLSMLYLLKQKYYLTIFPLFCLKYRERL